MLALQWLSLMLILIGHIFQVNFQKKNQLTVIHRVFSIFFWQNLQMMCFYNKVSKCYIVSSLLTFFPMYFFLVHIELHI